MFARRVVAPVLSCLPLAGCMLAKEGGEHTLQFDLAAASQYNFRGMPQNEHGVLQPSMQVGFPTRDDGDLDVRAWGNIDLTDDTGDAWFPDDNEGRFSQIDFEVDYSKTFGQIDVTAGLRNYNVLNGAEFTTSPAGSPRGPTSEVFIGLSHDFSWATPFAEVHYDFDEVDDLYLRGGFARGWDLRDRLRLDLTAWLGWSGEDMSAWNYGIAESGFADLAGTAMVSWAQDEHTTYHLTLSGSTIVDDRIADWMDDTLGIDSANVWVAAGVSWGF